ncbi:putative quinol monooxygenase [Klebsiella sp. I138]|uniref:putative quinol monooxygenase n=1 Tax=Klebsiella sp. I138 TaxID=2755385 RepID=UPI003DA7F13D
MGNQQLQVIAHYYTLPDEAENVANALHALADATRQEPDNLSYAFFQSPEDRRHFVILERYRSAGGLDAHRATSHFQHLGIEVIAPLLEKKEVESFLVPEPDTDN